MNILPVIDLMHGVVVRGVAGNRDTYQPIVSTLVKSCEPLQVARALRERFRFSRFYVADLDAIVYQRPNYDIYQQLIADGFEIWVDAGICDVQRAKMVAEVGVASLIVGLESIPDQAGLSMLIDQVGSEVLIFSLDLKAGVPLVQRGDWLDLSPLQIARQALKLGVERMIVLDLAQVGGNQGISTLSLCQEIRKYQPKMVNRLELITGGGVQSMNDVELAKTAGVDGLLIASALHDGRLKPADFARR